MAEDRLCLIQNLKNGAVTQVNGWDFNSFSQAGLGRVLATNEDGLYLLGDADDFAGVAIAGYLEFVVDFGQVVRLRSVWIGFETAGDLDLTITFDDRTLQARTFQLTPNHAGLQQHATKLFAARDDLGRYLRVKLANLAGCDFSLDSMEAIIVLKGRFRA